MTDSINKEDEINIEEINDEEEALVNYDIATYPSDFTLYGIYEMWKQTDITIPDFQREFVWSIKQSSLLIESFLLGLPVPPVFFYIDENNKNLVIDGQQRIMSIVYYFDGYFGNEEITGKKKIFRLTGLDSKSPYFKKSFNELDEVNQRKLKNTVLRALNIRQLAPTEDNTSIYHIFERLNTGGTPLKSQEIRNVVFRGDIVSQLRLLNRDDNWRLIMGKRNLDKHQRDVELVLRSFGLSSNVDQYEQPMKEYLNKIQLRNTNSSAPDFKKFIEDFPKAAKLIINSLGEKPFHIRGPLNASVFDSVFCTVLENIENIPNDLSKRFFTLLENKRYQELITTGTTDSKILKERFQISKQILLS
ncbi:MAG: DUF262 domain-containing protein [Ignavibacteriaceae bacterium]